ncbi:MAG: hypothetical protein AAGJ08_07805 [Cyanobacteria bacterium P01_H01_bin.35]
MQVSFYCLDDDIIQKLATCNLFYDTLNSLDIEAKQVKILETFKDRWENKIRRKRSNQELSQKDINKALKVASNLSIVSANKFNSSMNNLYFKLSDYTKKSNDKKKSIDWGEALLISYVSILNQKGNNHYFLTGDKRCLKALNNSGLSDVIESLQEKVWCLEQLILKNIEKIGFENVKNKFVPVNYCDKALKKVFSQETEQESRCTLIKYIENLRKDTGNLLNSYGNK